MKQTLTRSYRLALATSLGIFLIVSLLAVAPARGGPGDAPGATSPPVIRIDSDEEPPPEKTIWDRVTSGTAVLFHRNDQDHLREELAQAAAQLGVPAWHRAGFRGQGVRIAILDSGFSGYRSAVGKALPGTIKVKSFRADGQLDSKDSQHGILCAEVIHHLAPEAEILLANWEPEQPDQFLQAVRWARREGAQIISCSNIMPTWSDGEGGGPVHQALRSALGSGNQRSDSLFIASAGNTALRHWTGSLTPNREGWHQWTSGKRDNAIHPLGSDRVSVEICSAPAANLELIVHDSTADRDMAVAHCNPTHGGIAEIRFFPQYSHRYVTRLRALPGERAAPPSPARFHLTVLGGKLQYATRQGSIPFPADGAEVIAVGAVDEHGNRHSYSSCGPNRLSPKPDLVATVPFPSLWRPQQPFSGTSAAAPQAAALAALVWSHYPNWTPERVRLALRMSAHRTTPGHSVEKGFGLLRLPGVGRVGTAAGTR